MQLQAFERYQRSCAHPLRIISITPEPQQSDYESAKIETDTGLWRIRTARITPNKPGAFVAVWQRDEHGGTEPLSSTDECDGLLVFVEDGERFGVFRFTKAHLRELGITQSERSSGKRGFRLYPAWCTELNRQAQRTQQAQAKAFRMLD